MRSTGYVSSVGMFYAPIVRHEDDAGFVLRLAALIKCASKLKCFSGLEVCCIERPSNKIFLVRNEYAWTIELDFGMGNHRILYSKKFVWC